jgi:hypothetical protein
VARTVIALFDDRREAEVAVQELVDAGFRYEDLSVVASNSGDGGETANDEGGRAAGIGVGAGAVLGGFGGLLAALGTLAIPGVGPVLAAGPLLAALAGAGIGAAAGGLIGALVDLGLPSADAEKYAAGIRRGGALVVVHADDESAPRAAAVFGRHHPVDVEERARADAAGAGEHVAERVGAPVVEEGVYGGMRDAYGRGVRAYAHTRPEKSGAEGGAPAPSRTELDAELRRDFETTYAGREGSDERSWPAFRFGCLLAAETRPEATEWSIVEPDAQRRWEEIEPGTWPRNADTVRQAWERRRRPRAA